MLNSEELILNRWLASTRKIAMRYWLLVVVVLFTVGALPNSFARLGGADQTAAMQRVSSAMRVDNDIWVGSNVDLPWSKSKQ